jgi:hypothetical protein
MSQRHRHSEGGRQKERADASESKVQSLIILIFYDICDCGGEGDE